MVERVQTWQTERIPNCEKFMLTAQTTPALVRTLLCFASLTEDLLGERYDFVLTSRFQRNPLERRYGQNRQMSGGKFLVGLQDVTSSKKIIKIKSLQKVDCLFIQAFCPALQNIFRYQMTAGKQQLIL